MPFMVCGACSVGTMNWKSDKIVNTHLMVVTPDIRVGRLSGYWVSIFKDFVVGHQ